MAMILLVDDSDSVRKATARMLERMHHLVVKVENGEEAVGVLRAVNDDSLDLIISDVQMPHMDGVELYRWVVANRPEMVSKFIFCSDSEEILDSHEDVKYVPRLQKPTPIATFKKVISSYLQGAV